MKQKRISFDVPEDIHTYLKVYCAKNKIALRDFMFQMVQTYADKIKKEGVNVKQTS